MIPYPIALGELAEKRNEKLEVASYQSRYLFKRVMTDVLRVGGFGTTRWRRVRELVLEDQTPVIPD